MKLPLNLFCWASQKVAQATETRFDEAMDVVVRNRKLSLEHTEVKSMR